MLAPIVLIVYNRPEHTARALKSLAASEGAKMTDLYIYSDGARRAEDEALVKEVRRKCHDAEGFATVKVVERENNVGLAENVISGVSEVIETHGRVIVVEDDLEVSGFFLRYMNSALDYYDNRGVFSVSGYTPDVEMPHDYQFSTYMIHRNCSWGWGTWKRCWQKVDWNVGTFDHFIRDAGRRGEFDASGTDLSAMLLRWKTGEINSWSIRFCYAGFENREPTVYPRKSLVRNTGADGSGTNMKATGRYATPLAANVSLSSFLPGVAPDSEIVSQFKRYYDCSAPRRVINMLKRLKYIILH